MSVLPTTTHRLLIELPARTGLESTAPARGPGLEALLPPAPQATVTGGREWAASLPIRPEPSLHPWDEAHRAVSDPARLGLEAVAGPVYAEPDFVQQFPYRGPESGGLEALAAAINPCQLRPSDSEWPRRDDQFAWHLDDDYAELRRARERVGDPSGRRVRIVILDTGYDPGHSTRPRHLHVELQRNFAEGDPGDATDPGRHSPLNNPGHGTGTLALLAGNRVQPFGISFDDFLGGAPFAEVVPVRIADSVIHFRTSSMAAGLEYAVEIGCDVVSISMGGVPTRAWATAVNRAYEAGVAIFAAAGNHFGPLPPQAIVYPARFNRVVAMCGATADKTPYYKEGLHRQMHGCFGPPAKMRTALAAFTPNTPWAALGCEAVINRDGSGTSSATPQGAAAAALWLQQAPIPQGIAPWQKVEAVRHALFSSADKSRPDGETYFGQGLLRAHQALDVPFHTDLPMTPPDSASFSWLRVLGALESAPVAPGRELMYEVEALQIFEQTPRLQELVGGADPQTDSLDPATRKRLFEALRQSPLASQALRTHLTELLPRL